MIQRIEQPEQRQEDKQPPDILIDLRIVGQMRRRRQMLDALKKWNESQQCQNQAEPVCEVQT